eukprot:CAMPEP_0194141988 /NCGR_PEP_ID=MMETSP0152-20130528/11320_1 /TAXON_ID=1049557 /ORGANISM="Thalassiothrix antarctica, Strain L6-D1" /LENGTH=742 /DNA_ID=CAMNT_0038840783 /DNA_START=87 /DNA_END=2312 /DNA_ORIENTATION=+
MVTTKVAVMTSDRTVQEAAMSLTAPVKRKKNITENCINTGNAIIFAGADEEHEMLLHEEERLSADLAQFLSNPSLKAALADGSLDLTSYSSTVEGELHELETQCIDVYRSKKEEIAMLRAELESCDAVLAALQEMLLGFQADLGGLSGDIRNLQEKSRTLGIQLRNRRQAESGLKEFLNHVVIAPNLVHAICKGPINDTFLHCVQDLNRIQKDIHDQIPRDWACGEAPSKTVAGHEMKDHVYKLRLVAVSRIRDYFLVQMGFLRRPQTNVRMIQVHGLLKYALLQDFLEKTSPEIASEIYKVYVESMSKTMYSLFRTYQAQLLQLDSSNTKGATATRQDVIAIEDSALRDAITSKAKSRVDTFTLGNRANNVLEEVSFRPILSHVALAEEKSYPYEMLFRSIMLHLMDAVTNEYVFCRQFFKRDAFQQLFSATLGLLLEQLENYLFGCHDALALLLMIKIAHVHGRILKARHVNSLHPFFDTITSLLWPRLKAIMDAHLRSIKSANAQKLGGVDLHAHYVSRRYAEFTCSILSILHRGQKDVNELNNQISPRRLASVKKVEPAAGSANASKNIVPTQNHNSKSGNNTENIFFSSMEHSTSSKNSKPKAGDMLLADLDSMQNEIISLLERLADKHSTNKKRIVFLINNLDQMMCIFQERRVVGKELNRFVELLMTQRELFVEEELLTSFSKMIAFVQQSESHMKALSSTNQSHSATTPSLTSSMDIINPQVVESLIREFSSNW